MRNDIIDEYFAHGYEAAMHNKKQSQESVRRQYEDVNGAVQRLKDTAIKDLMFYIKDYNNIIERQRQKIVKAKNMLNSPAGTQAKSSYVRTNSGEASIREEIKVIEYWMNKDIEAKEELENKLQEIKSDKTGKKAKAWVDSRKHNLHHSSLEEEDMTNEYTEINAYLQHGWFTDLFKSKPKYTSTGSTAGMPTNLPRTATSGGSAGSKQLVYSDQLRKLNNNLVEYELKMNQAKASYEEYRKLYNDTKKNIANTEKALTEATKEAARTGFDPSKSSVAPPARRYASSNAILPQTTITGSTEGLKKTRYHVKKKK